MDRKLAAILAADVVGYSALMERDEKGTHERLKGHRQELFEPAVEKHHGRIFKLMGDGVMAEFGSVVDAVECAVSLQRGLAERNADVPQDERILVRIGINLGEVIVEGEDRYGEGVNIAARLEQLAEPGGICVSGKVAKEVEKKLAFGFEAMGAQKVKNIAEPVQAFRVKLDGMPAKSVRPAGKFGLWRVVAALALAAALALTAAITLSGAWWAMNRNQAAIPVAGPSIAVLPFDNLSDDKEQGYLADGIAEDLTTELARVPGLFVVSRNAAFGFRRQNLQPVEIAGRLGVRYILEGSIRRAGDDLRLNAQLIDAETGGHLWAERFDGAWAQVFDLQDKIVTEIAKALQLRLVAGQRAAQIAGGTSNPAAYEAYLRGLEAGNRGQPEDFPVAARHYEQAIALDPKFGAAIAELAWLYWSADGVDTREKALGLGVDDAIRRSDAYLEQAAKNPSPTYYQLLADRLVWEQKSDEAIAASQRAIALDPSDQYGYHEMSFALTMNGRAADGLGYVDAATRVAPSWTPYRYYLAGLATFSLGRFEDAAAALEKIESQSENADFWTKYTGLVMLTATYGHLGRVADAAATKEKLKPYLIDTGDGELTGLLAMKDLPFKNYADLERVFEGLRKAGVPELPFGFDAKSKDRLTADEIKALFYGHEIQGRDSISGEAYWRATAADGSYRASLGALSFTGVSWFEGDVMCNANQLSPRGCRAVFRNPAGTFEAKNEYIIFRHRDRFEFSVVK
ncbi:MAG: guanylate cyclase [Mesorhizobium sp.]|uniref:adenylate/guanylate cyclase domain-containing protein n=1 Tax=Mesorhizobium sp. TaxID=1871066 RepID=UPI00121E65DE|nr:adenylate/guanylate cyclase domain-containing protein [Mesorhizobium sp.]TIP25039.1 MAG: guanylate cyclase [Mesorhizobium sp.]